MRNLRLYLLVLAVIVIVAMVLIVSTGGNTQQSNLSSFDNQPVPQSLLSALSVPNTISAAVGSGFALNFPKSVSGAQPLLIGGKPTVVYIGADYCPYCAIERWGLVIALQRFGSFSGLEYMTSSPTDIGASTPTFTFANATYASNYITFVARETQGNKLVNGTYPQLQRLNSTLLAIMNKYNPSGGIPFIDYANKSIQMNGANYGDPTLLANRNWSTIAGLLSNSSSAQSQALVGIANLVTAQICKIDNNTPPSVCGQSYVQTIENALR